MPRRTNYPDGMKVRTREELQSNVDLEKQVCRSTDDKENESVFDDEHLKVVKDEKEPDNKRKKYVASKIFDDKLSEQDRIKSSRLFDIIQRQLENFIFDVDAANHNMINYLESSDIFHLFNINSYGNNLLKVIEEADLNDAFHEYLKKNQ